GLRQEERAAQIDGDTAVEAFRREREHVVAAQRRDARVVDEAVERTERVARPLQQCRMRADVRDVALEVDGLAAVRTNGIEGEAGVLLRLEAYDGDVEACAREGRARRAADAARAAGDERRAARVSGHGRFRGALSSSLNVVS